MNGTRDPALPREGAGGGGQGQTLVPLAVRARADEGVLILRAVGGGRQRVPDEGGYSGATAVREGRGGGGRRDGAVVAGFFLQKFLLGRPRRGELEQAGGLKHGDATLPAAGVLAGGSGRGAGGGKSHVAPVFLPSLCLHHTWGRGGVIVGVFVFPELSGDLGITRRRDAAIWKKGAARRELRRRVGGAGGARRRRAAWHGALSFGVSVSIPICQRPSQRVRRSSRMGGRMFLLGVDLLNLTFSITMPLQQEALWSAV